MRGSSGWMAFVKNMVRSNSERGSGPSCPVSFLPTAPTRGSPFRPASSCFSTDQSRGSASVRLSAVLSSA